MDNTFGKSLEYTILDTGGKKIYIESIYIYIYKSG